MLELCLHHWQNLGLWPQTEEPIRWQKLPCPLLFGMFQSATVFGLIWVSNPLTFILIIMLILYVRSEIISRELQEWVWDSNSKIYVFTFNITGLSSSVSIGMLVLVTQVLVHKCLSRTYEFLKGEQSKEQVRWISPELKWARWDAKQHVIMMWCETWGHGSQQPLVTKGWGRSKRYCSTLFLCFFLSPPEQSCSKNKQHLGIMQNAGFKYFHRPRSKIFPK